ncbi:MAG: nucleoid-structuring protein H-NS [Chryseolinea sp.]
MMLTIRNSSKLIVLALVLISAFSCQSKKKAMQASNAAAEKARIEREAADKKADAELLAARKAEEDKAKREAEQNAKESESRSSTPAVKVGQYFSAISSSSNLGSANASINEALTLFASPETPVFIVISESGGMKDYDKPTTIKDYLNYLKDQKKNINSVSGVKTDGNGKITELELKKN